MGKKKMNFNFSTPDYKEDKRETEEERGRRKEKEKWEREVKEEKEMLEKGEIDKHLILSRIERHIIETNSCYYQLCDFAYFHRPTWSVIIRENSNHIFRLIDSYTKYRQHQHNVYGDPGTNARRDVTFDPPDRNRFV